MPQAAAGTMTERIFVPYMNLGGGQNTKKDAHAIRRDQLASMVNCWYAFGDAISKRPGSAAFITATGATGNGGPVKCVKTARFNDTTYYIVQQGTSLMFAKAGDAVYTQITTALGAGALPIECAQMFDPSTGKDTLFICDGVSQPWTWTGPPATVLGHAAVPKNNGNTAPITPRFVATLGNNSKLFYSGESSYPSAVFISDAFFPQSFTIALTASSPYGGADTGGVNLYAPAIIGQNDGIDGGIVTGIRGLGSAMMVYKESAIYRMDETQLMGDTAFRVTMVSGSNGALSPRSIVQWDGFHTFLSIDGLYMTYGIPESPESTICISADVPTYFDNTLTGFPAVCQNYATAIAERMGNRLCVWFDDGSGTPVRGLWFDFNKTNPESGLPCNGEIQGMNVGGVAVARGPGDKGLMVWGDAGQDRVGQFGLGFADFGNPITMTFFGRSDFFIEEFGPDAPEQTKFVDNVKVFVALPQLAMGEEITLQGTLVTDLLSQYAMSSTINPGNLSGGGTWGQNWAPAGSAQLVWSAPAAASAYQVGILNGGDVPQNYGRVIQFGLQESSVYPVTILGFNIEVNAGAATR